MTYFKERFPLPVYLIMCGGFSFSAAALADAKFFAWPTLYSFLGLLLFFGLLRLMDELKDYRKDLVAHPERPLPRGVLRPSEVSSVIQYLALGMVLYGCFGIGLVNAEAGVTYLLITGYLWLMYREFYAGEWLEHQQLLYAVSHQLILIPLCAFAVFSVNPDYITSPATYLYGGLVLGSFFSYEVCRKLDPEAHPLLKTYRFLYGPAGCFGLVVVASGLAAVTAWRLGVHPILWPATALVLLTFVLFVRRRYKLVEVVASLSLVLHLWVLALSGVFS